jgi:Uncharacterized conserved protein
MSRDSAYLLDILLYAQDVQDFTKEMDKEIFLLDHKTQSAVIRCLEVMGEAAKRLSPIVKETYPDISWSKIARMRDLLIHAYARADLEKVWDTVKNDIPTLISILKPLIPPEEK